MKLHPTLSNPEIDLLPDGDSDDLRVQVWALLTTLYPKANTLERRHETRYPFPFLIHLMPFGDEEGLTSMSDSMVVVGKHLSQSGLGFYHPQPLPCRRAIASLESGQGAWFGFLLDLRWCRFTRQGWYESGGRFLKAVASPLEK